MYVATERIALPVMEDREIHPGITVPMATGDSVIKEPGDKITIKELQDAGQTPESIQALVQDGAMEAA
jgi:hypothetical protein